MDKKHETDDYLALLEDATNESYPDDCLDCQEEIEEAAKDATKECPQEIQQAISSAVDDAKASMSDMVKTEAYFTPKPSCWQELYTNEVKHVKDTLGVVKELSKNSVASAVNKVDEKKTALLDAATGAIAALQAIPEQLSKESNQIEMDALRFSRMNEEMKQSMRNLEKFKKETKELHDFYAGLYGSEQADEMIDKRCKQFDECIEANKMCRKMMSQFIALAKDKETPVHPVRMSEYLNAAKESYTSTMKEATAHMASIRSAVKAKAWDMQNSLLDRVKHTFTKCSSYLSQKLQEVKAEVRARANTGKKIYQAVSRLRPAVSLHIGMTDTATKENMVDKYINTERTKPIEQMINRMARSGMTMDAISRQKAAFLEGVSKSFDAAMQQSEVKKIVATNTVALAQ